MTNISESNEEDARQKLNELQDLFQKRRDADSKGDQAQVSALDREIVSAMHNVGNAYPDQESKDAWHAKASQYESSSAEEKENILMPLAKGLGILIAAPFAVAGGAIFAAGGILYGAGKTIQGVGNLLTGGVFNH
ncbi:hypothetical protein RhiXN_06100 [Rhizoctonia solani]|uniref:Uncharacterized protein n=1 Tax=Rhizoctonia solani TaxID=456999 RepID=A0A8H8NZD4_9AGAM|nr:uncharacterized protein RhiXN_06100 [Rhizoctonia solani]QRW21111.1 hypothetical protein RhiXN_06100 [Rhizoctonia solani]